MRGFAVVIAVAVVGCVRPDLPTCGERTCPPDTTCVAALNVCASDAAMTACDGLADGTVCTAGSIAGSCMMGVCVESHCGDGIATGREQCDGDDFQGETCEDFQLYYGGPTCTASCLIDTSSCSGRCGDGITQFDKLEECDGNRPLYSCATRGYDYGHIDCTNRCFDSSLTDCGNFVLRPVYGIEISSNGAKILDVMLISDRTIVAVDLLGLVIVDHGIETDLPGSFTAIAGLPADPGDPSSVERVFVANGTSVTELVGTQLGAPHTFAGSVAGLSMDTRAKKLWAAYSLPSQCMVASLDLTTNVWTELVRSSQSPCTTSRAIVAGNGTAYVLEDTADPAADNVFPVAGGAVSGIHGQQLNAGLDDEVVIATKSVPSGIVAIKNASGGIRQIQIIDPLAPTNATWIDALGVGDEYIVSGPGWSGPLGIPIAMRLAPDYAPVNLTSWTSLGIVFRRLADGRVLAWSNSIASLVEPMTIGPNFTGIGGFQRLEGARLLPPGTFIGWGDDNTNAQVVLDLNDAQSVATMSGTIKDVTVAGSSAYISLSGGPSIRGIYQWTPRSTPVVLTQTQTIDPLTASVTPAGDQIAAIDKNNVLFTSTGGGAFAQITGPWTTAYGVYARALNDLYVSTEAGVYHRKGTPTWTLLAGTHVNSPRDLELFADATTLAVAGSDQVKLICHVDSTPALCDTIDTGATAVSGTAPTDVWLTSATARLTPTPGLVHYDGKDLAPVGVPQRQTAKAIAVTADVIVEGGDVSMYKLVRFPVP